MLEPIATSALNRLLRRNAWALERLRAHVGKTALLSIPPVELRLLVCGNGEVTAAPGDTPPDVTIVLGSGVLLRLAARDETAWTAAHVSGDMELAGAIDHLRRNLEWDYEEDLSRVFGDVAAHRIARALRALDGWGRAAAVNVGQALVEYATHEQPTLASREGIREFGRAVDEVRDHVERIAKRLELLQRRLDAGVTPRGPA